MSKMLKMQVVKAFLLLYFSQSLVDCEDCTQDCPIPRMVIVGETGVGKSSLANALLGCDPLASNCMFPVCTDIESCTNETTINVGKWLGNGEDFTLVDTPGFGDSSGRDNQFIQEMLTVLEGKLGSANVILLVLEGETPRFSTGLQDMLKQMSAIFGDQWWDYMMIGVSKWKFDNESITDREEMCENYPERCKDEAWFISQFNQELKTTFNIDKNFTFAFMDSWSQKKPDNEDPVQQQHWKEETDKLWKEADRDDLIEFFTIDEILEENNDLKEENNDLKEEIKNLNARIDKFYGSPESKLKLASVTTKTADVTDGGSVATITMRITNKSRQTSCTTELANYGSDTQHRNRWNYFDLFGSDCRDFDFGSINDTFEVEFKRSGHDGWRVERVHLTFDYGAWLLCDYDKSGCSVDSSDFVCGDKICVLQNPL